MSRTDYYTYIPNGRMRRTGSAQNMTSKPRTFARQATFNTEPADSFSEGGSIRRGSIELPVVGSDRHNATETPATGKTTTNNKNTINNNHRVVVDDDDDNTDVIEGETDNNNDNNDHHRSQDTTVNGQHQNNAPPPPSNQSSPIYGSKSAYEKFNKRYASRAVKTPSVNEDNLSDLDILSDVGLADDSDCDVVPSITPLSLSARRKTRKEPRIKVPSSKLDNTEPTIEEETTQEILNNKTPDRNLQNQSKTNSSGVLPPRQIRSQTIVYEKRLETVADELVVSGNDNDGSVLESSTKPKTDTPPRPLSRKYRNRPVDRATEVRDTGRGAPPVVENEAKKHQQPVTIAAERKDDNIIINPAARLVKDDLESSFCESDWQPRKPDGGSDSALVVASDGGINVGSRKNNNNNTRTVGRKIDHTSEPLTAREEKVNTFETQPPKRPLSAGDRPQPNVSKSGDLQNEAESSRPQSRKAPRTPLISNFLENNQSNGETSDPPSVVSISEKNSTAYSGVPRRVGDTKRNLVIPHKKIKAFLPPPPTPSSDPNASAKMETSDGYDYESETFEEILKDRNSMVQAERTYQKRINQLEEELKGMINQCQALSDENKELRKNIDGYKKYEQSEKSEKSESKPENNQSPIELTTRIARLETEKENLVQTNEKLALALKDEGKKKQQSDIVFVENTKLKNKNSELEKKVRTLQGEAELLTAKAQELSSTTTNGSGKSAVLDFKNKELQVALADLKYENKSLHSKVKSLENEKHLITNSLEEKRVEIHEMMRAMQNETTTEAGLKQSKARLEEAQGEILSVKNELEEMKKLLQESENKKAKLQNGLGQRDSEIKRIKHEQETKDKIIGDLRTTAEKLRDEISKNEETRQGYKDAEKETAALKSRIGSLKIEIESSLSENQRLKAEREDANQEIERLRTDHVVTTDAMAESRRYFRKWEVERESRNKAEVELAKQQDEIDNLHASLKASGVKTNVILGRLRAAEDDREKFRGPNAEELETNNKILKDENKKLRLMLVEKNVDLLHKTNEKEILDNRVGILERKQKDAATRVRQLSGWVDSINSSNEMRQSDGHRNGDNNTNYHNNSNNNNNNPNNNKQQAPPNAKMSILRPSMSSNVTHHTHQTPHHHNHSNISSSSSHAFKAPPPVKRTGVKEPIIAVINPRSRTKKTPRARTPPPSWDDRGKLYEDDEGSNHTPVSLPLISESKPRTPTDFSSGYFQMYKERMKRARDRQFAVD